jgi:ABC-type transport system involved in cytochrome c biogenesis permease subunit
MFILIVHIILSLVGLLGFIAGTLRLFLNPEELQSQNHWKYSMIEWGWMLYTAGVVFGGIWAKLSYGSFWVWDIKETLSLLTVILYFIVIVLNPTAKSLRVKKLFAFLGLGSAIITLIIPNFVISYHFF